MGKIAFEEVADERRADPVVATANKPSALAQALLDGKTLKLAKRIPTPKALRTAGKRIVCRTTANGVIAWAEVAPVTPAVETTTTPTPITSATAQKGKR